MAQSFDAIYEDGVLRPLEPLNLVDGLRVRVTLSPPTGPLTEEQVQASLRLGQKTYEGLSDEEIDALEAEILSGRRLRGPVQEEPR